MNNRDGTITHYDSKLVADAADDNVNMEIVDYTLKLQKEVYQNRPTEDFLVSKFFNLFNVKSYK